MLMEKFFIRGRLIASNIYKGNCFFVIVMFFCFYLFLFCLIKKESKVGIDFISRPWSINQTRRKNLVPVDNKN